MIASARDQDSRRSSKDGWQQNLIRQTTLRLVEKEKRSEHAYDDMLHVSGGDLSGQNAMDSKPNGIGIEGLLKDSMAEGSSDEGHDLQAADGAPSAPCTGCYVRGLATGQFEAGRRQEKQYLALDISYDGKTVEHAYGAKVIGRKITSKGREEELLHVIGKYTTAQGENRYFEGISSDGKWDQVVSYLQLPKQLKQLSSGISDAIHRDELGLLVDVGTISPAGKGMKMFWEPLRDSYFLQVTQDFYRRL